MKKLFALLMIAGMAVSTAAAQNRAPAPPRSVASKPRPPATGDFSSSRAPDCRAIVSTIASARFIRSGCPCGSTPRCVIFAAVKSDAEAFQWQKKAADEEWTGFHGF